MDFKSVTNAFLVLAGHIFQRVANLMHNTPAGTLYPDKLRE